MTKKIRNIEELSQEIERQKDEYLKNGGDLKFFKPDFYPGDDYSLSNGHFPNVFLAGACLRKVTINNADLTCADLTGVKLQQADLSGANLYGANLSGADLSNANLTEANLTGAYLYGADLREADLRGADLAGANLRWADLAGTDFTGADLRGAIFSRSQIFKSLFKNTIITQSYFDDLKERYNQDFMAGFIVKD